MRAFHPALLLLLSIFVSLFAATLPAHAQRWDEQLRRALKNGGAIAVDEKGAVLFSYRADEGFIPASTLKLATIACALETLGPSYRFETTFQFSADKVLYVRGFGDPTLVSEELQRIAAALRPLVTRVDAIVLDDGYFAPDLAPDGRSDSTNPYDAVNGALVANYNTVFLRRRGGKIESAEPQTPLVPVARELGSRMKANPERINLGGDRTRILQNFGQLLAAFLRAEGVDTSRAGIRPGHAPAEVPLIYTHRSASTLEEAARPILEFSTNFSANQIFLLLGAKKFGPPAVYEKGARVMKDCLTERFHWKDVSIVEGAGLSRKNRIRPREMIELLSFYSRYAGRQELLPLEKGKFRAKTGSLTGVGAIAGFMSPPGQGRVRFAIFVNDYVPFAYKFSLAEMLYAGLAVKRSSPSETE